MSEAKHTPGPWKIVGPDQDDRNRVHISSNGHWYRFASVVVRMIGNEKDSPVGLANANLICAAPDLYAICAELEGAIDAQTYDYAKTFHGDIPDDAEFNVNLTWKQIHALTLAIAKATGAS